MSVTKNVAIAALGLVGLLTLAPVTGTTPCNASPLKPPPPPPPPPVTLQWCEDTVECGTYDQAVQKAADYEEEDPANPGTYFTDWRLPTVDELQAALQDGSFGGTTHLNLNYWSMWSSTTNGNWAWVCKLVTDANGDPIPPSGEKKKVWKGASGGSSLDAKFVREM